MGLIVKKKKKYSWATWRSSPFFLYTYQLTHNRDIKWLHFTHYLSPHSIRGTNKFSEGESTILLPFNESNFCSICVWIWGVIRSSLYVFLHFKNDASLLLSFTCALSGRVVEIDWDENNIDKVPMHPKEPTFIIFIFNWRIIALQCVSFCCATAWISCKYTYIASLLSFPPTVPPFHSRWSYFNDTLC